MPETISIGLQIVTIRYFKN